MKTSASAKKTKTTKTAAKRKSAAKAAKTAKATTKKPVKSEKVTTPVAAKEVVPAATTPAEAAQTAPKKPMDKFRRLFLWNVWLAVLYGVQGIALLLLSATKTVPVTAEFLSQDQLASALTDKPVLATATEYLFDLNIAQLLAAMFFIASIVHLLVATVYRPRYQESLERRANRFRWIEYALTGSIFMVTFGLLAGIRDLGTLVALGVLTVVAFVGAFIIELYAPFGRRPSRFLGGVSLLAGITPWVVIGLALFGANAWGTGAIPAYLCWLFGTGVVLSTVFGIVLYLQHKKTEGKWADYLHGERTYLVLGFVAKTALAWQIFAGTLRP